MSAQQPVVFYIERWKALFFGLLTSVFSLILGASLIKAFLLGDLSVFGALALLFLTILFAIGAADYLWAFLRKPVSARIDAKGLSGRKFEPLTWDQIEAVRAFKGRKRHRYLGITLKRPDAFQEGQSPMARIRSKMSRWRYEQDIVVEGYLLRTNAVEEIALAAQQFQTMGALGGSPARPPHNHVT